MNSFSSITLALVAVSNVEIMKSSLKLRVEKINLVLDAPSKALRQSFYKKLH
jgi:hypothetical protein